MRAYRVMQWLLRAACRVFFRRVEVVGLENLPPGPILFCGNHPNSLLDPILITAFCGRIVHFAAKDTLFESRLLRLFLGALGAVPVRRRMDHPDGPLDNQGAFDALIDVLGEGRAVGIFPEGISHAEAQLAPLKTGAARIALQVAQRWPARPIHVVPSGLCYLTRNRFRSSVLVQFGTPIAVTAPPADPEASRAATTALTAQIDAGLRGLTINADSWDTIWVLDGVRRLYQPEGISLEERVELARRFNTVYPTVKDDPEVRAILARVRGFLTRMSAAGLGDDVLRRELSIRETVARVVGHLLLIAFWAPLFVIGAPLHAPLGLLFKLLGQRLAPRKDVVATTKFVLGFLSILAIYVGVPLWVGLHHGAAWALTFAFLLPLSGHAFVRVIGRADALRRVALTSYRVLTLRREVAALRAERAALEVVVVATVDRLRPAAMVPLFPRDAT